MALSTLPHDKNLVREILAGNPKGINKLLAKHGHELVEYTRIFSQQDDALFQRIYEDILVDILRQIALFLRRRNTSLRMFAFESAASTLRKRYTELYNQKAKIKKSHAPPALSALEPWKEISLIPLQSCLNLLSSRDRELLALRYHFGFSYDEISDIIKEARVSFEERFIHARHTFRTSLIELLSKA